MSQTNAAQLKPCKTPEPQCVRACYLEGESVGQKKEGDNGERASRGIVSLETLSKDSQCFLTCKSGVSSRLTITEESRFLLSIFLETAWKQRKKQFTVCEKYNEMQKANKTTRL